MAKKKAGKRIGGSGELVDVLRAAVRDSGLTDYAISQQTGVAIPVISRFRRGERDLTLTTASKIAAAFGMELRKIDQPSTPYS